MNCDADHVIVLLFVVINILWNLYKEHKSGASTPSDEPETSPEWEAWHDVDFEPDETYEQFEAQDEVSDQPTVESKDIYLEGISQRSGTLHSQLRAVDRGWVGEGRALEHLKSLSRETEAQLNHFDQNLAQEKAKRETELSRRGLHRALTLLEREVQAVLEYQSVLKLSGHKSLSVAERLITFTLEPLISFRHAESRDISATFIPYPQDHSDPEALFPRRSQAIDVPIDLGLLDAPSLWPLIIPSITGALDEALPSWRDERRKYLGARAHSPLPRAHRRTLSWPIQDALGVWSETLWADVFSVLRFGPAAVRALIDSFEGEDRHALTCVQPHPIHTGSIDQFPPPMIRVEVALSTLERCGHLYESKTLGAIWRAQVGAELIVTLNTHQELDFPFDSVRTELIEWVDRLFSKTWMSWAGHTLSDIPDFEMTPGHWKWVLELSEKVLIEGESVSLTESIRWPVLAHSSQKAPGMTAFLNRVASAQSQLSHIERAPTEEASSTYDDWIAAIVLSDLYTRRSPMGRRSKRHR